jgi:hypothetical protein
MADEKILTRDLSGATLNSLVARLQKGAYADFCGDWAFGGPVVEEMGIHISRRYPDIWDAVIKPEHYTNGTQGVVRETGASGSTPLEAAMRCYVSAMLGSSVNISEWVSS